VKGVEAPFQLLVSVFAMILVVAIAFRVLNIVSNERCDQRWEQSLSALSSAISSAAMAEPPTTEVVNLQLKCGDDFKHEIFVDQAEKSRCARLCGEYVSTCYILVHNVYNRHNELIAQQFSCIRHLSPYLYALLKSGKGNCGSDYTDFFNGSGGTADLNAWLDPKPVLTVYVFRNSDSIPVCIGKG